MAYCDNDLTAILPDGRMFEFREAEPVFEREIHVDNQNPVASDENDVTSSNAPSRPLMRQLR